MKSVILLLFFISFSVFCQNDKLSNNSLYDISKYESNDLDRQGEHLRKILNLKEDDVIVNLNDSKYVCLIDNNVFCKVICGNKLINTIKLDLVKSNLCKVYIKKLAELNPPELKFEEGKNGSRIRVEDGGEIAIKIYKKNKKLVLYSYAPDVYIREEVPFFEKRKIFVECYSQILSFFYDEEFYRVKALDTLYIYIERSKEEKKFAHIEIINNTSSQEYLLSFGNLSVNFTNFFQRENVILTMDKRKFLKKNNKIIRLEYLNKFCACDLDNLISTRSRLVYLVDNKDSTRRKVKLKKVIGGSLFGWNCYD